MAATSQKALYLPKLATGEWTGTMNLTEPQAGSDVGALRATATPRGDGTYAIKGQKIYISFGDHDMADNIIHLVLARTPDAPAGTKGISLFLVPKYRLDADGNPGEANGVKTVSIEHKMGINASPTCVLQFGEDGEQRRRADRPRIRRHPRDVHDDEQRAAECRPAGRADRRGRDAKGDVVRARTRAVGARRWRAAIRSRSSSIPMSAACCCA